MPNRLAASTSPYLLQHQDNPVDWWEWGPEAFTEASGSDRPILLSVGYAACHWCHVMAHESFEDAATAAYMNEHFVNIKVDREERPDVDAVYMQATTARTGPGGWPRPGLPHAVPPRARGRAVLRRNVLPEPAASGAAGVPAGARGALRRLDQPARGGRPGRRGRVRAPPDRGGARGRAAPRRRGAVRRGRVPGSRVRRHLGGIRYGAQVPALHGARVPAATCRADRIAERRGDGRPHPAGDGPRWHLRPARRRLRAVLRGPGLGGSALREDALRQRPAGRRLRALVATER